MLYESASEALRLPSSLKRARACVSEESGSGMKYLCLVFLLASWSVRSESSCDTKTDPPFLVNATIEIMAGSNRKWEINKETGELEWEGAVSGLGGRVVDYLGYPANYGYIEETLSSEAEGGDGDALDILVLGDQVARAEQVAVRPLAVLRLLDQSEIDDKIIAVQMSGPFSSLTSMSGLRQKYPKAAEIIALWFANYKRQGGLEVLEWGDEAVARSLISAALCEYARQGTNGAYKPR